MTSLPLLALLIAVAGPGSTHPTRYVPHCAMPATVADVRTLASLPAGARAALTGLFGGGSMADADEPYNGTDVISIARPAATRQFFRALGRGDRWAVWYEQGGFATRLRAVGIDAAREPADVTAIGPRTFVGGSFADLCRASRVFITGTRPTVTP